ncbi:hypothetical protein ACRYI5_01870 [Furfurilactobacillus sp. WILCCON 0119]|uniref:DUF1659 domain-containing protein n=1 Tax=Furfurilactobacillus entadae TaxID=2922307 RepID=UPI0035EDF364
MAQKWLKSTVQFELTGDSHPAPLKRSYAGVSQSATDAQLRQFGQAIASLSNDQVTDTTILSKQTLTD